ncbi:MAG: prolipoprotein diacylglyceryl transferase family protein [Patescibacteria group bacterium]
MFPIIFSFGPFTLYTFNIFLIVGAVGAAFLFWQRTHAEHFEDDEVFDVMIISTVMALIIARIAYIVLHLTTIFMEWKEWLVVLTKPGFDELTALVVGLWYIWFLSRRKKWDAYELADFATVSISFLLIFVWIGRFFAGTFLGDVTKLPIGVTFPNVFDMRHPSQLYFAFLFLFVYVLLLWIEKKYRFFQWYRAGRHTANSGFVLSIFLSLYGLFHLLMATIDLQQVVVFGIRLDLFFYIVMMFYGLGLLFARSGSNTFSKKKWGKTASTGDSAKRSRVRFWGKK